MLLLYHANSGCLCKLWLGVKLCSWQHVDSVIKVSRGDGVTMWRFLSIMLSCCQAALPATVGPAASSITVTYLGWQEDLLTLGHAGMLLIIFCGWKERVSLKYPTLENGESLFGTTPVWTGDLSSPAWWPWWMLQQHSGLRLKREREFLPVFRTGCGVAVAVVSTGRKWLVS